MGCWNETCMLSNLPILESDKVKLIFLTSKMETTNLIGRSHYVYCTDILYPAFLPIDAEYDDYGTVENITEDWNTQIILDFVITHYGNEFKFDGEELKTDLTLEVLIRGVERGDQYGRDNAAYKNKAGSWVPLPLSFVMIRKDVWDKTVELQYNYKNDIFQRSDRSTIEDYYKQFLENKKKLAELRGEKSFSQESMRVVIDLRNKLDFTGNRFLSAKIESYGYFLPLLKYHDFFEENLENESILLDIKHKWSEIYIISQALEQLRRGWMLQPGGGSQDRDFEHHQKFAKIIIDCAEIGLHKYDEPEDDVDPGEEEDFDNED